MMKLTVKAEVEKESKDFSYNFDQPVVTLGRLKENDIQLPLSTVSGNHAQILQEGENYYLVDRGSINGTYLNEQKIPSGEKKLLHDGDVIRIQTFEIYFSSGAMLNIDQGATVQVARQMVMEVLGSWEAKSKEQPRLIVMGGPNNAMQIDLNEGKSVVIGRGSNCDIMIDHPSVSRRHAEVTFSWSGAFLKDLKSANGLYCNDQRVSGTQKLHDRDEIRPGQQSISDPVYIVFSNPAEALLSKIEQSQETELAAAQNASGGQFKTQLDSMLPVQAAPAGSTAPAITDQQMQRPQSSAPTMDETQDAADSISLQPSRVAAGKKKNPLGPVIGVLLLLGIIGAVVWYFRSGKTDPVFNQVVPAEAASGETVTITGKSLDGAGVSAAAILQRNAPIIDIQESAIRVKIPVLAQMEPTQRDSQIILQTSRGAITLPFKLIVAPQLRSVEPGSGKPGAEVRIEYSGSSTPPRVLFGSKEAKITSRNGEYITCAVPQLSSITPPGMKVPVKVVVNNVQSRNNFTFTVLAMPSLEAVNPVYGAPGTEVRIRTNMDVLNPSVFFGDLQAEVKSTQPKEIVAVVPVPAETVPSSGLKVPVTMKSADGSITSKTDFTIYPGAAKPPEVFQLTFSSKPYSENLGYNEYEVESNVGPLLVLVAKDVYGSSNARADAVANNLNNAIPFFKSNSNASVQLVKTEENALYAEAGTAENRRLLLHVHPEDALAYGKITGHVVTVDDLAAWWQMLIDSYYKVFVQMRNPAESGILSAGGGVLQNVFKFYAVANSEGEKFYKKDFLNTMPADQRARLQMLSLSVPVRLTTVDGKWGGTVTNILYSDISEPNLEIVLTLHQGSNGAITGNVDLNWKVAMGGSEGGFQNVAYKKLGSYDITGSYDKTKSYPVEFSFVEKEQGRLNFVGRLEGNSLRGSFAISATGEQGSWSAKPK